MNSYFDVLRRAETCFGAQVAFVDEMRRTTYADLGERARRIAGAFGKLGVRPGDRVAVLSVNSVLYAELSLALPCAGIVVVPLNTRLSPAELSAIVAGCRPEVLVIDGLVDELRAALADQVTCRVLTAAEVEELIDSAPAARLGDGIGLGDLAAIFYTGGTTAAAKGVMLSHGNKLADAWHFLVCLGITGEDRWLVLGPMFHAAGSFSLLPCTWVGATQVIMGRFDAAAALDMIEREAVSATFGVPTMLREMAQTQASAGRDVSSLRLLGHGGAPISEADLTSAHRAFPATSLVSMYGATEMAPIATAIARHERFLGTARALTVGHPVVGVELVIVDEFGAPVEAGSIGEIAVRGENVMLGYWENPDETAAVLRDGWYHSGDLGYVDASGLVYVADRKKDVIISGGENVYCAEVETVLAAFPGVQEAAVVARPDARWGEIVHAVVVADDDLDPAALLAHCREHLAGYKVPKSVELRSEPLPRSGAGKVLKRALR